MFSVTPIFKDRADAGRQLARALSDMALSDPLILALPRGGVPLAFEIAKALHAPLDLLIVRKIGAPGHPEFGIGAVVDGSDPQVVLNEDAMRILAPSPDYIDSETRRQFEEIERRRRAYLGDREPISLKGRTVILVDDGIATGGTVRAALQALQKTKIRRLILAVPVSSRDVLEQLRAQAYEVICLATPEPFNAVGLHYGNFEQTTDEEVVALLNEARTFGTEAP